MCFWNEEPEPWWEQYPGLMTLYPLCKHGQQTADAITTAATAIKRASGDHAERADLLTVLGIFGKLRDRTLDVISLIGRELMRDSPLYEDIAEEGGQTALRKAILQVLSVRFGDEAAGEFAEELERLRNREQLEEIHRLALKSRRITQFRKAMPKA